jgi:hypothetical protein
MKRIPPAIGAPMIRASEVVMSGRIRSKSARGIVVADHKQYVAIVSEEHRAASVAFVLHSGSRQGSPLAPTTARNAGG